MAAASLLAVVAGACSIAAAGDKELASDVIRIADVVEPACLTESASVELGELVIARLDRREMVQLSRRALASLVRRRAPMLGGLEADEAVVTFRRPRPSAVSYECARASRDIEAGAVLTSADVISASCERAANPPDFAYDRQSGLTRARQAIRGGAALGRIAPLPQQAVEAGAALTLSATSGPVQVERRVRALQDARAGERLFVRGDEGPSFAIEFPEIAP